MYGRISAQYCKVQLLHFEKLLVCPMMKMVVFFAVGHLRNIAKYHGLENDAMEMEKNEQQ